MWTAITAILGLFSSIGKFLMELFSEKKKLKKKAVKDGKEAVDNNDTAGVTAALDKLRNK